MPAPAGLDAGTASQPIPSVRPTVVGEEGSMCEVHVAFSGPYAWLSGEPTTSVAKAPEAVAPGLYLWTAPSVSGHLVYYVGEAAKTLAQRVEEPVRTTVRPVQVHFTWSERPVGAPDRLEA